MGAMKRTFRDWGGRPWWYWRSVANRRQRGGAAFTPAILFANGEEGGWYDPSDLETMFQDATGTTPVTADGDPVGLVLDKSQWGGKSYAALLAGQVNSRPAGAGVDADTGTGVSTDDGTTITLSGTDGSNRARRTWELTDLTIGSFYEVSFEATEVTGSGVGLAISSSASGTPYSPLQTSPGVSRAIFQTPATTRVLTLFTPSGGATATIPNASVIFKEIPGNHLIQATAANRPLYKTSGGLHWLEGDGVDDWMRAAFTIAQPWERISGIDQITWTLNESIFGGGAANAGFLLQTPSSPIVAAHSGTALQAPDATLDPMIVTERHNGASSRIAINSNAYTTGNAGTTLPGGITLFSNVAASPTSHARCYGIIMREGTMTDEQIAASRTWMAAKAGVTL